MFCLSSILEHTRFYGSYLTADSEICPPGALLSTPPQAVTTEMTDRNLSTCHPHPVSFNPVHSRLVAWRHIHKRKAFQIKVLGLELQCSPQNLILYAMESTAVLSRCTSLAGIHISGDMICCPFNCFEQRHDIQTKGTYAEKILLVWRKVEHRTTERICEVQL